MKNQKAALLRTNSQKVPHYVDFFCWLQRTRYHFVRLEEIGNASSSRFDTFLLQPSTLTDLEGKAGHACLAGFDAKNPVRNVHPLVASHDPTAAHIMGHLLRARSSCAQIRVRQNRDRNVSPASGGRVNIQRPITLF